MRTCWPVVVVAALLGGTALSAQEYRPRWSQPQEDNHSGITPVSASVTLGAPTEAAVPVTPGAPSIPEVPPQYAPTTAPLNAPPSYIPGNPAGEDNGVYATPYNGYPPPALAVPLPPVAPAPPPPPGPGCAGCGKSVISPHCLARLKQWLCYRPILGGCAKCGGCCTFNCFPKPYLYFLDDCHEGKCHTLPHCTDEDKCGCLGKLLSFGKGCGGH